MTTVEAKKLFEETLCQLWPDWEPTDTECRLQIERLRKYDYDRATNTVNDFYFKYKTSGNKPQVAKLFEMLSVSACIEREQEEEFVRQPGLTYGKEAFDLMIAKILNGEYGDNEKERRTKRFVEYYINETVFKVEEKRKIEASYNIPKTNREAMLDEVGGLLKSSPPPVDINNERNKWIKELREK